MSSIKRKLQRKNKGKEKLLNLKEVNEKLMVEADKIKSNIQKLQEEYGFDIGEFSFKPITVNELKNIK